MVFISGYLLIWNYLHDKNNSMTSVRISGQDNVAAAVVTYTRQVILKPGWLRTVCIINQNPSTAKNYFPCCEGFFNGHKRIECLKSFSDVSWAIVPQPSKWQFWFPEQPLKDKVRKEALTCRFQASLSYYSRLFDKPSARQRCICQYQSVYLHQKPKDRQMQ